MLSIDKLTPADRAAWQVLYQGYNTFYERELSPQAYDQVWQTLQDDSRVHGLGAKLDGTLVGITHFLTHPNVFDPEHDSCYLQDLFTAEHARGQGVARALIEQVTAWAKARDCGRVYWSTHETNATARRLYDQVALNRGFILYQINL